MFGVIVKVSIDDLFEINWNQMPNKSFCEKLTVALTLLKGIENLDSNKQFG